MSTEDSKEQQKQQRENKQLNNKINGEDEEGQIVVDKKLEGPNRPAD